MSRVYPVTGDRGFVCSKCGHLLIRAERDRDGARTGRLWVNLVGARCLTDPPPADRRRRGDDGLCSKGLGDDPPKVMFFANVPWPGDGHTLVYTLVGECPKCHGRVRADTRELWTMIAIGLVAFGSSDEMPDGPVRQRIVAPRVLRPVVY